MLTCIASSCAGLISLHTLTQPLLGRPHTHQRPPDKAVFIGDITPAADPPAFVSAAAQMYTTYLAGSTAQASRVPSLVINTPGWVKVGGRRPHCTA